MEIAGLNSKINGGRVRGLIESIPQYYPEFSSEDFANVPVWSGLRLCSPDGLPYVGRTSAYRNFAVAGGHAMMGISLGPISGELIGQTICGEPYSIDIRLLDPDRFNGTAAACNLPPLPCTQGRGLG